MLQAVFSSIVQISPKMPWLFLAYHFPLYRRGDITITECWYKPNYGFVLRNRKQAKHPCTDLRRGTNGSMGILMPEIIGKTVYRHTAEILFPYRR